MVALLRANERVGQDVERNQGLVVMCIKGKVQKSKCGTHVVVRCKILKHFGVTALAFARLSANCHQHQVKCFGVVVAMQSQQENKKEIRICAMTGTNLSDRHDARGFLIRDVDGTL